MDEIHGNISKVLGDVLAEVALVVMDIAMEQYGPVDFDTSLNIAGALGKAMDVACQRAIAGEYSEAA